MKEQQDRAGIKRNWPEYEIEGIIGHGAYGQVYKIKREKLGNISFSAVKVIHIPLDNQMDDLLFSEGTSRITIKEYYEKQAKDFLKENSLMEKLKGATNIVTIEDCIVELNQDEISYTIYIKMEFLESLESLMEKYCLESDNIVSLGKDICDALMICENENIIHRDIKPANVFINSYGIFKLGDFGIARQIEHTKTNMTQVGTGMYMAPELYRGDIADKRVDIYSLGIMLYRVANYGCFPFMDPTNPDPIQRDEALLKRLKGETIPLPSGVDEELGRIIVKACAHKADERYGSAKELKDDLELWSVRKKYTNMINEDKEQKEITSWKTEDYTISDRNNIENQNNNMNDFKKNNNYKENHNGLILVSALFMMLLAIVILSFTFFMKRKDDELVVKEKEISSQMQTDQSEMTEDMIIMEPTEDNNLNEEELPEVLKDAEEFNDHYYKIIDTSLTWTQARERCEEEGGHLVTITSSEEQIFISELIEKQGVMKHYWLGGTDKYNEGEWVWITGEPWTYSHWEPGQPNNSTREDPINGQDYLEIQVTKGDNGEEEYLTWTDIVNDGTSRGNEEAPEYNSKPYYGYICEWDSKDFDK